MTFIINFFVAAVLMGTTLMYGTLGEILTEKSGNMNLGGTHLYGRLLRLNCGIPV